MSMEPAPVPALALAASIESGQRLIIVVEGGSHVDVLDALVGLLDGSAQPPQLAKRLAELRRRMPRTGGQWARSLDWEGGRLSVFSVPAPGAGARGGARAFCFGALPSGVTWSAFAEAAAPSAADALAALGRELFAIWIRNRDTFGRDRGVQASGDWSWIVRHESGRALSVRLIWIA